MTLADFQKITGYKTPTDYIHFLRGACAGNDEMKRHETAEDYRTMAYLVEALPVVATGKEWAQAGKPISH